jgi:hypothetical protein
MVEIDRSYSNTNIGASGNILAWLDAHQPFAKKVASCRNVDHTNSLNK